MTFEHSPTYMREAADNVDRAVVRVNEMLLAAENHLEDSAGNRAALAWTCDTGATLLFNGQFLVLVRAPSDSVHVAKAKLHERIEALRVLAAYFEATQ